VTGHALIVDDDKFMVKTLGDILELQGWYVETAYSGAAAVELASTRPFDVVLMDIKMPGMDGVAALQAIKEVRKDLRVILMTAYAAQDRLVEAERAGVLRILSKPVDIGTLLPLLASAVRARRQVLLVDHDAAFLRTLSEVLQLQGFQTVVAEDLAHAQQLMAENMPRAVLLHLHLGSVPVREAVSAVHAVSPEMALIVYSGRPDAAEEVQEVIPSGWIHAYLQKPFAVEEVTGVLNGIRDSG
jgi:DNA-binding NtrC family response regulator